MDQPLRRNPKSLFLLLLISVGMGTAFAQEVPEPERSQDRQPQRQIPIRIGNRTAFELMAGTDELTLDERANIINRRIRQAQTNGWAVPESLSTVSDSSWRQIRLGDLVIVTVGPKDSAASGQSVAALATTWRLGLRQALVAQQTTQTVRSVALKIALGLLFPILLGVVFLLVGRGSRWLERQGAAFQQRVAGGIRIGGIEVVHLGPLGTMITALTRLLHVAAYVAVFYAGVVVFFSLFPQTRPLGTRLFNAVLLPLTGFIRETLAFVPALIAAVVVAVLVRLALWVIDLVFDQLDQRDVPILRRSHRLLIALRHVVRPVIIVAAVFFVLSYVPGLSTKFIDYTAVGLLALVIASFWRPSESVVSDVILSYFRPFQPGDRLCLGEMTGEVIQQTAFFVKLRDESGREHIIPNRLFLTSPFTLHRKES